MNTNAITPVLAETLASANKGTFTGLIIKKVGKEVGRGADRKTYGDDLVHVVLVTGFKYENLVARSLAEVEGFIGAGTTYIDTFIGRCVRKGITGKDGAPITHADVTKALASVKASFERTLDGTSVSTSDHVFDPLLVDGEPVRGCKVYKGNPNGENASEPGTIYLAGLKIGETVVEAAENGPIPRSNSRGDVVAADIIKASLPVGRYRSYRLHPNSGFILRAGGAAAAAATKGGVTIDTDAVNAAVNLLVA